MFRDDFYSTKPPKWAKHGGRQTVHHTRFLALMVIFMIVSSLLFLFGAIMLWNGLHSDDHPLTHQLNGADEKPVLAWPNEEWDQQLARDMYNEKVISAAERVNLAVVSVISYVKNKEGKQQQVGIGSGVIFASQGGKAHVVTNHHVVEKGEQFEVVLSDETRIKAQVIGSDLLSDLAVMEMSNDKVTQYAVFGNSDQLRVGEAAIAVGNPLGLGFSNTTTLGVISSTRRAIPISLSNNGFYDWEVNVIQTDAAINRGNSGGALVNLNGEVIGINSMKIANFGVEGLGFAIPANTVVPIIESLMTYGKVKRPFIGVATLDYDYLNEEEKALVPSSVNEGLLVMSASGPAEQAGLREEDFIVALDDTPINSTIELRKYLYENKAIGESLEVTYYRGKKKQTVTLVLGESG